MQKIKDSVGKEIENTFKDLKEELEEALYSYWNIATLILDKSGIKVIPPGFEYISIERNFFSALFLYSYFRAGIPKPRRILYATANQCLRGMVTGCDNILDNEYKKRLIQICRNRRQNFVQYLTSWFQTVFCFQSFTKSTRPVA